MPRTGMRGAAMARVQSVHDLVTGQELHLTAVRMGSRFLRVDPHVPGLRPPHPLGP
jgi:hypothetical protein